MTSTTTPPPGSMAAIKKGCTCPVQDNNFGRGDDNGRFIISMRCPLHGEEMR